MQFTNNQIDISTLPKFEELELEPISPKYFSVIVFNLVLVYGSLIAGLVVLKIVVSSDDPITDLFWYLIAALSVAFIGHTIIYKLGFHKRLFALREQDIIYSEGLFKNDTTTLPFNRIQHIEISKSFLERKFGLATLKIFSAGESGGDISIKGLPESVANAQYAFLTKLLNDRV